VSPLLRLYPRRWRERYGEEFAALLAESPPGLGLIIDVLGGAIDARAREGGMTVKRWVPWAALLACDLVIGWMNLRATDDVQPVAAALMLAGFGFGLYRPWRAWLFAILLFVAIPISGAYADAINFHPGLTRPAPLYESLVALVPTLIGAYVGAAIGWAMRRART
jgi:hypothetical protein